MNWIEKRVAREQMLKTNTPTVFAEVVSAIEAACNSFNAAYSSDKIAPVESKRGADGELLIRRMVRIPSENTNTYIENEIFIQIRMQVDPTLRIMAGYQGHRHIQSLVFEIQSDENSAFIVTFDKRVTPDEVSHRVLEPLFFSPFFS
jgi:hypothetical protein